MLCPNQARFNGITVDDVPIHLGHNATHSIFCPKENLRIPLRLRGCISYVDCHYPSEKEIHECTWINITDPGIWDPHSESFELEEERSIALGKGRNISVTNVYNRGSIQCDVETRNILDVYVTKTLSRTSDIKPESLAGLWGITKDVAKKTIDATTQLGLRSGIYPLVRRFCTKQAHLRYNQLGGTYGTF